MVHYNQLLRSRYKEKFAVTFNAIAESAQEGVGFISNASQANFDNGNKKELKINKRLQLVASGSKTTAIAKINEDAERKKRSGE
jgi:hypothetical protein